MSASKPLSEIKLPKLSKLKIQLAEKLNTDSKFKGLNNFNWKARRLMLQERERLRLE
jgi:hypothetical protein